MAKTDSIKSQRVKNVTCPKCGRAAMAYEFSSRDCVVAVCRSVRRCGVRIPMYGVHIVNADKKHRDRTLEHLIKTGQWDR